MREKTRKLVITFHTTAAAMAMENPLPPAGAATGRLIAVPRELTADCGMAWCAPTDAAPALRALADSRNLEYEGWQELLV